MIETKADHVGLKARASRLRWPIALIVVVGFYFGLVYLNESLTHESTDDAFIEAHIVSIAPKIAGVIAQVLVRDNQFVKQGDPLAEIDARDFDLQLTRRRAASQTSQANVHAMVSVLELMLAKMTTAEAAAKQARALEDSARAANVDVQAIFQRDQALLKSRTISQQEYDAALAAASSAAANLSAAEQNSAVADSKVVEAKTQWTASQAGVDWAKAQMVEAEVGVNGAQLDLSYTKMMAPCNGRVTRKAAEPGNYVQVGQTLMAIVPSDVWVVANFKETQLVRIRTNQLAQLEVDSLSPSHFLGHVESVQSGSGARFSLLPPENAVGNFVKVVQRVPVKITFDQPLPVEKAVGPGISVVASVQVGSFYAPRWALGLVALLAGLVVGLAMGVSTKKSAPE